MWLFFLIPVKGIFPHGCLKIRDFMKYDVIVIGAGPAGLFTSIHCNGLDVCLLEKNLSAGKKLLISGGRQANITHTGEIEDFIPHYGHNGKFIKPALYNFTNKDLTTFFRSRGINLINNDEGNIFPQSLRSADILDCLLKEVKNAGVIIKYGEDVLDVIYEEPVFKVITNTREYTASNLVLATGGQSYPSTGSTGAGYAFAKKLGHSVIPPRPALTTFVIEDHPFYELSGISFGNIDISVYRNNKKIAKNCGDVLINHKGLSGPGILNISRYVMMDDVVKICFIPPDDKEKFREEFMDNVKTNSKKSVKSIFQNYPLPKRLISKIFELAETPEDIAFNAMNKKTRNSLFDMFLDCPLIVESVGDFNTAMVTTGGVALDQVNPKTMESRLIKGLYFVGEVLDIDGDTGGYNLQAAFSSGVLAAGSIMDFCNS